MDYFDSRYFSRNRNLLLLVGLWPFQSKIGKLPRQFFVVCMMGSGIGVQIAKLVTTQLPMDVQAAIVSTAFGFLVSLSKYVSFAIQRKNIEILLGSIETAWKDLFNDIDLGITQECAKDGKKYAFIYSAYLISTVTMMIVPYSILQPLLDIVAPANETREKLFIFHGEYFVDEQEYFYPIILHMTIIVVLESTLLVSVDTTYHAFIYHVRGMFKVISYRLEHAFDEFKLGTECTDNANSETRARIASAVEYHLTVIQFLDVLVSTFSIEQFVTFFLSFCNISITLYWAALSLATISGLLLALLYGAFQMVWVFLLMYPCQKVMDDSSVIAFKAYSGLWYNAPFELQALLIPIMQRGTKPNIIYSVKILEMSSEFYGKAIQLSISYFTVLLSLTTT